MKYILKVILLVLLICLSGCSSTSSTAEQTLDETEKQTLTIELLSINASAGNGHHLLGQKIKRWAEAHPNVSVTIRWKMNDFDRIPKPSWERMEVPSALYKDAADVPDIVELVPNQMRDLYNLGKIEPLNIKESALDDFVITSSDGHVLGVKSKINPMVVYYNQEVFHQLGLESPTKLWDAAQLGDAVTRLKSAGYDVYIPVSPYTLEWAVSLFGGRMIAADGATFTGYLDSDDAVKGAQWLANFDTNMDREWKGETLAPMPYDLLDGKYALAVEYAYGFNAGATDSYEAIVQANGQIGVAALPAGTNGINPALVSGLSITSKSTHQALAMQLLRDLTSDKESLYSDIAMHTMEANEDKLDEPADEERKALILDETKRSVPATLYMHEFNAAVSFTLIWGGNPSPLKDIRNHLPIRDALKRYASQMEESRGTS
ncbi:extracellular solute-binding protein [Paenibacillus sp. CCS19]|uniref:ABC transporter substrate-binding protein n=1 Tax=Paenibacillus sp. CCS19 TaxID=3158387 RepID=UPI00295EF66C|nr:extracellular solute-binding protein [Paenibacillus cellulosilyticus]